MAEALLVLFVLGFGLASTIGLYLLIEAETSNPTVVDRRTAEREARDQGGLRGDQARRRTETDRLERERDHGRQLDTEPDSERESERTTETDATADDHSSGWDDR